jgi:4-amino-4-deoxy-L-arabinose transferase-like glycosyltransferase
VSDRRAELWDLGVVFVLALALRSAVILSTQESGLISDMYEYHSRATMLLEGKRLPDSFRGPGFPVFVAAMYRLPGPDLLIARFGNAVLVSLSAALTVGLARGISASWAALGAGLVVAIYPASLLSAAYLMPEGLYGTLTLLTLVLSQEMTSLRWSLAGAAAGLTALTRSIGIGLLPAILLGRLTLWTGPEKKRAALHSVVLVAAALLTLTPWLWHTQTVSGGLMLDSSSAYNVLLGSNPRARERLELADGTWVWETYFGGATTEADRNRRALAASWKWIRENPGSWFRLLPLKMTYLWGLEGREHAWAYSNSYFGQRSTLTVRVWGLLLLLCFPPLAVFAVIGLMRPGLLSSPTAASIAFILILTTLMHGLSFSETRFHLPLVPLLAVLGARGLAGPGRLNAAQRVLVAVFALALAAGWYRQLPELVDKYQRLTAVDGWKTMLSF